MTRSWIFVALTAVLMAADAPAAVAQATPYVPAQDPAYDDLATLVSAGLVRNIMVGEGPYSQAAFRRFVAEAGGRVDGVAPSARITEALARLATRFARIDAVRPSYVRADVAGAASPDRAARTGADGSIDAAINPLLQRNQGRILEDGGTAAVEAGVEFETGRVAGAFSPRAYLGVPRGDGGTEVDADVVAAYGRVVMGPVALDVGRNNVTMGYGWDGGGMISGNGRGLDMIRVAADRPVRLPGALAGLGLFQASLALADMGNNRDISGEKMTLIRLSGRFGRYLEGGLNYLILQGGEGAPPATFRERLHDLIFFWEGGSGPAISDKVAGADLRITVPRAQASLYANFLTTDDRGIFGQPARGYWEDAAWLVGAEARGLGAEGRVDVGLEWRHDGPRAHTHHQFTSGVTVDDRILGDPLGPNAAGLSARVAWTGPASRVRVTGAWERYSGDDFYWQLFDYGYDWRRRSDNPDEVRTRVEVDYLRYAGWRGMETSLRLGYEHVTRFNYTDASRHNVLAQASVRYLW